MERRNFQWKDELSAGLGRWQVRAHGQKRAFGFRAHKEGRVSSGIYYPALIMESGEYHR